MKTCFKCHQQKPFEGFYKHSQMADGYLNKCKECTKKDVFQRRHGENRDAILEYDRQRGKNPHRQEANRLRNDVYRKIFKERKNANNKVKRAVLKGLIQRMPCWCCGEKAEAHHPDYSRPLDVVWLCSSHHKQAHAISKE
jgi:hypothetical protein